MSGGSWDYVSGQFDDVADRLSGDCRANRRALGDLVRRVGQAMHDIEWVDSGDYTEGDEDEAIRKALGAEAPYLVMQAVVHDLHEIVDTLTRALDDAANQARGLGDGVHIARARAAPPKKSLRLGPRIRRRP